MSFDINWWCVWFYNNKIEQLVHASVCVCPDIQHAGSLESTKEAEELLEVQRRATLAS